LHPALDADESLAFARAELDQLQRIKNPSLRLAKRYYLQGLVARLAGESPALPRPKCVALRSHLRLLPDGGVVVCQFNTEPVGNLLQQSFDDVWHSAATRGARAWVDACKGCWAECEVMPNAVYSGDLLLHALAEAMRSVRQARQRQLSPPLLHRVRGLGPDRTVTGTRICPLHGRLAPQRDVAGVKRLGDVLDGWLASRARRG
jgi:hypothetical protein